MHGHLKTHVSTQDTVIQALKEQLWSARLTIISLMPDDIARRLGSYSDCKTPREADRWISETVDWLIRRTEATEPETHTWPHPGAPCPLCGGSSLHPYHNGFTLPLGLERHLLGKVNAQPCSVMEATIRLAHEHWASYIPALREGERLALAERRRTEVAYRISPFGEPQLIEEVGAAPRDREQLAWAEERLAALGFRRVVEGNVIAWIDDRDNRTVYADPRAQGKITFEVWRTPLPKPGRYPQPSGTFYLLDSYHIKLVEKYAKRVEDVLKN